MAIPSPGQITGWISSRSCSGSATLVLKTRSGSAGAWVNASVVTNVNPATFPTPTFYQGNKGQHWQACVISAKANGCSGVFVK